MIGSMFHESVKGRFGSRLTSTTGSTTTAAAPSSPGGGWSIPPIG